ncbi:MAG: hypothetical protein JWO14_3984 [Solirubrobacterales bacterium]|nr:hypothetical protein [Solirubrobacterales bacterium]
MSGPVQIAVVAGMVLLLVHVSLRRFGSRDVRVSELFNTAEDRLTLILGAAAVIAGIVEENIKALRESWDGKRN